MGHCNKKHKVAIGTTIGALVAAAGAVLFFTKTKPGKKATKDIKAHAMHLGKEISHKISKARKMTQKKYDEIVDDIVDEYGKKKKMATTTVATIKKDLKAHWKDIQKELKKK